MLCYKWALLKFDVFLSFVLELHLGLEQSSVAECVDIGIKVLGQKLLLNQVHKMNRRCLKMGSNFFGNLYYDI